MTSEIDALLRYFGPADHTSRHPPGGIGDSVVMTNDGDGLRDLAAALLYLYVADVDATYTQALAENAVSLEEPTDMPYDGRRVKDPWGNTWQIATHVRDLQVAEFR